jgi:integrase
MTITKRRSGYQASVLINSQRLRKQFESKELAEAWALECKANHLRGRDVSNSVTEGARTWEELRKLTHARFWKDTKGEQTSFLNSTSVVKFFGELTSVDCIRADKIDAYVSFLQDSGNSNGTINRKLAALSKMLKFAVEHDWMAKAPVIHRKKEYEGRIRWVTKDEERTLLRTLLELNEPFVHDFCMFLVDTGCRVSEGLGLKWVDITEQGKTCTFWDTKSNKARTIPVTARVWNMLNLTQGNGMPGPFTRIDQTIFNKVWNKAKDRMGLQDDDQFVPHCLRHTCASRLVQAGIQLLAVKEFLGHKSIQVTLRYAHLLPQNLVDAAKKLEEIHT